MMYRFSSWSKMFNFFISIIIIIVTTILAVKLYLVNKWKTFSEECDLTDKVVIITGANSGIGESAAEEFARRNARVILACRSEKRGNDARKRIMAATGKNDVIVKTVDLSDLESIRNFCDDVKETEEKVDILVNNAAVFNEPFSRTKDHLEVNCATNYFGHFLLTNLLLDLMKRSSGARILNVSSFLHTRSILDIDSLTPDHVMFNSRLLKIPEDRLPGMLYSYSKLLLVMFSNQLAIRLKSDGIAVNSICPGMVSTNILRNAPLFMRMVIKSISFFIKSPKQGTQTILYCAMSCEVDKITGRYFSNCTDVSATEVHPLAKDTQKCSRLWDESEKLVGLK